VHIILEHRDYLLRIGRIHRDSRLGEIAWIWCEREYLRLRRSGQILTE
jgi:hypothetical protein